MRHWFMNIMHLSRLQFWFLPLFLLAAALVLAISPAARAEHSLTQVWKAEGLAVPESVLYIKDKKEPYLLVSLIDGVPTEVDGKGGIARLGTDGEVLDAEWITGLNAPKGMGTDGKLLYVADITELVVIDIKKQRVVKKVPVPEAVFLNDVTVSSLGVVYVSDTRTHRVHMYDGKKIHLYLDGVDNANGLFALGNSLVVGSAKQLLIFDANKKPLVLAQGFAENIDGVEMVARGEFVVSCWLGLVYYVYGDGRIQQMLDLREQKINTADLGFDPEQRVVLVPNFFKNSVTAYRLE